MSPKLGGIRGYNWALYGSKWRKLPNVRTYLPEYSMLDPRR